MDPDCVGERRMRESSLIEMTDPFLIQEQVALKFKMHSRDMLSPLKIVSFSGLSEIMKIMNEMTNVSIL